MRITGEIREALEKAVANAGGQTEFARMTGISRQNLSKYLHGKIKKFRIESWVKLNPHLVPYLFPPTEELVLVRNTDSRIADALESIARSLELIANPASVLDTKTGKITPASRNPGSICEM